MVFVTYPDILLEISNSRYGLGLLNLHKDTCMANIYRICIGYTQHATKILSLRVLYLSRYKKTIPPAYDEVCNRSDRVHHNFIWSQTVETYWIIIPCWITGELHMKLVGGNFKANRRKCLFIQHVCVQRSFLLWRWLKMLSDKLTKLLIICKSQIILDKYILGICCWPVFPPFPYFVEEQDFIQTSVHTVAYICQASQTASSLLPCPMVETTPW